MNLNLKKIMNAMKKVCAVMMSLIAVMMVTFSAAAADKYSINRNDLPQAAQEFLTKYFPKQG